MNFTLLNYSLALFLTSFFTFFLGFFVLLKNRKNLMGRIYALFSFSVTLWSIFMLIAVNVDNSFWALFYFRLMFISALLVPVTNFHFILLFLKVALNKTYKFFIILGYSIVLSAAVLSWTPYIFKEVVSKYFLDYYPVATPLFSFYVFMFLLYAVLVIILLFKDYLSLEEKKRSQLIFFFCATTLGYVGGLSNILLIYNIYIPIYTPYANYFFIINSLAVGSTLINYKLMDIKFLFQRAFIYSVVVAAVSGFIIGISFLSGWFLNNVPGFKPWIVPVVAGFFSVAIGNIIWSKTKEIDKLKYMFVTVFAHKIRTPLTEIKWSASELNTIFNKSKIKNKEVDIYVDNIFSASNRLIDLTNELLSVSRTGDEVYDLNVESQKLEDIANYVIEASRPYADRKKVKISTFFPNNLPELKFDKGKIGFVIQILLDNAIVYTKDRINITIDISKKSIIFNIEDNGIGISKDDQKHIFSKFYRSANAYRADTEGVGVNLFLAKNIIERHKGSIGVRSEREKGSLFWFELPIL